MPERGAVKHDTPARLVEDLRALPPEVAFVIFDPVARDRSGRINPTRPVEITDFCRQMATHVA